MKKNKSKEIIVIQDTREQAPLALTKYGLQVEISTMAFGDYTVKYPDLRSTLVFERKSIDDFCMCCGKDRKRFEKELTALRGYKMPYIIGEFGLKDILGQKYRSQINPNSVLSSIARWSCDGIHFLFCDNAAGASYVVAKIIQFSCLYWQSLATSMFDAPREIAQYSVDLTSVIAE